MRTALDHDAISHAPFVAVTEIFVVSEDEPGQWRIADRVQDIVHGPYPDEGAALRVAMEAVRDARRWEVHVLDRCGTLVSSYNSDEDAMHVKVV